MDKSYRGCALVIKSPTSLQLLVHFTTWCILQHQEHPFSIMEIIVEAQDIGMPEGERNYKWTKGITIESLKLSESTKVQPR